jgi:GntR family transcriptional regulator, histidine utilization repressor
VKTPVLHERIRRDVERRILSGSWPPGHRIPYEHELMRRYGCSRMTVSKALATLAEAGLLVRRRRAGSFVARPRIESAVLAIPDLQVEIERRGAPYAYELLSRSVGRLANGDPLASFFARAGRGRAGSVLALECRHFASEQVFALERRVISLAAVPAAVDVDFSAVAPGHWLLGHVAWTEAEHRICSLAAEASTARRLRIEPGSACLSLERRTWRGTEGITHVQQIFPANGYDLVARFRPAAHGGAAVSSPPPPRARTAARRA